MKIKWKEEYSCFELKIDEQHMKMVDLINKMDDLVEMGDKCDLYDEIVRVFNELKDYTVYHFHYEEEAFEKYGYDSFSKKIQILEHKSFVNKINAINFREIDDDQIAAVQQVLDYVGKWLTNHILSTDKQFGEFLKQNNKL